MNLLPDHARHTGGRREFITAGLAGLGATLATRAQAIVPTATPVPVEVRPVLPASREHMIDKVQSEFLFFDDPVAKLHAHLRLERDLGEQTYTITWYHFVVFIVPVTQAPVPIMRYEGMEFSYLRHLGNNNFRLHAHNLSYPRDLHSGEFTDQVKNPVTGEMMTIAPTIITNDPGTVHNPLGFRNVNGDGTYQDRYAMFRREDNLIKLDSVRGAPPEKPITHQENSCAWCNYDEFTNTSISSLPQHFVGSYLYDYPRSMNMGDRPGHLMAMFDGKKISSVEELPDAYLERTRREHPELLSPLWKHFDTPLPFEL